MTQELLFGADIDGFRLETPRNDGNRNRMREKPETACKRTPDICSTMGMEDSCSLNLKPTEDTPQNDSALKPNKVKKWIKKREYKKNGRKLTGIRKTRIRKPANRSRSGWNVFLTEFCNRQDQKGLNKGQSFRNAAKLYRSLSESDRKKYCDIAAAFPSRANHHTAEQETAVDVSRIKKQIKNLCQKLTEHGHQTAVIDISWEDGISVTGNCQISNFLEKNPVFEWKLLNAILGSSHENNCQDKNLVIPDGLAKKRPSAYCKDIWKKVINNEENPLLTVVHERQPYMTAVDTNTEIISMNDNSSEDSYTEMDDEAKMVTQDKGRHNVNQKMLQCISNSEKNNLARDNEAISTVNATQEADTVHNEVKMNTTTTSSNSGGITSKSLDNDNNFTNVNQLADESANGYTYEVDYIMKHKELDGVTWYRIKWKGYPHSFNTWEPEENLPKLLRKRYWVKKGKKRRKRKKCY